MSRLPCGCVERTDKQGREEVSLCVNCAAEYLERHEAARRSGSHVWRDANPQEVTQ